MPRTINTAIESVPLNLLKPHPRNVNQGDFGAIQQSVETNGFYGTLVANKRTGHILAGNHRYAVAKQIGMDSVPVAWVDVDDEQEVRILIADNRTTRLGIDDEAGLTALLAELANTPTGLTGTGFDGEDLDRLIADLAGPTELLGDPDEVPEPPADPITKPGDLWLLGDHRLLCGDSTKAEDVERLMAGAKADMVLSDPPYGVSYVGKTKDALKVENDELDEGSLTKLVRDAFDNAESNCRAGAYWYATVPPGPLHILFADDWKRRGILRQIMVWAKDSMVLGHSEYHYQHEPILFGWIPGDRHKNSDRTRTTLWQYDRPKANREHPTMKPVDLWNQAVNDGSRKGELVYDPFLGSGTTLIAAEQLGRKCYGMEISPQYCDVIVKRWEILTGKTARLEAQDGTTD